MLVTLVLGVLFVVLQYKGFQWLWERGVHFEGSSGAGQFLYIIFGLHALHVLGDQQLALQAWRDATNLAPRDRQMRYNLARLYLVMGNEAEARRQRDLLAQDGIASRVLVADLDAHIEDARQ